MIFDMFNDNDSAIIMMFLSDVPGTIFDLPKYTDISILVALQ